MKRTFKFIISLLIFGFFSTNIVLAEERFCLDKEGLILPIFDGSECINSSDIEIDKDEFSFIIKHEAFPFIAILLFFKGYYLLDKNISAEFKAILINLILLAFVKDFWIIVLPIWGVLIPATIESNFLKNKSLN